MVKQTARGQMGQLVQRLGYANYQGLYWDWIDNFVSTLGFAQHHKVSISDAHALLDNARYLYSGTIRP